MVINYPSLVCDPGSTLASDRTWAEFKSISIWLPGFFSEYSGFPPSSKLPLSQLHPVVAGLSLNWDPVTSGILPFHWIIIGKIKKSTRVLRQHLKICGAHTYRLQPLKVVITMEQACEVVIDGPHLPPGVLLLFLEGHFSSTKTFSGATIPSTMKLI